jgi:hypothetical protein
MSEVYVASDMPTRYPYKLQNPGTVNERVRATAETFILDSGISQDTTNADVLDLAAQFAADYVVPCDVLHDQTATTASVRDFLSRYERHACDATPLIPLQPPHAEHYYDLPGHDHYCLGGMAVERVPDATALNWIREFREVAGPEPHVHALGIGGGITIARQLAGNGLVDSVDCSTPEVAALYGSVLDGELRQREVRVHNGEGVQQRNIPLATLNSYQIRDVWQREASRGGVQTTLAEVTGDDA